MRLALRVKASARVLCCTAVLEGSGETSFRVGSYGRDRTDPPTLGLRDANGHRLAHEWVASGWALLARCSGLTSHARCQLY